MDIIYECNKCSTNYPASEVNTKCEEEFCGGIITAYDLGNAKDGIMLPIQITSHNTGQ